MIDESDLEREVERLRAEIAQLKDAAVESERASEERFRSVLENMSEGLMLFDAEVNLVFQNPASLRIHGFDPADPGRIGHDELPATWNAWDETGRPITFDEWPVSRVFRRERFQGQVLRVVRVETGLEFYASYNGCPILDTEGRIVLGFITIRDITEEVRARHRLEEVTRTAESNLGQLRAVVDSMSDGIVVSDLDGNVRRMNPEAMRLHGFTDEKDSQRKLQEFVDNFELHAVGGALVPVEDWPLARVIRGEALFGAQYEVRNLRTGESAYRTYSGRPVRDAAGRPILAVVTVRDITREKHAEDELRRTAQALRDANQRLLDADRRKNEFLGMLSHELRNPLAPIWNSLYILEHSDPAGERAHHARDVVTRQVGALSRLVDDLLDVTRIVRNKVELRQAELDLAALLTRICGDYRTIMEERQLSLDCAVSGSLWVKGDEARLGQVIGNLLQNAAKFTPPGGQVDLSLAAENGWAVIRVHDSGCGIESPLLGEIFEPFTQAKQPLARTAGGLGLGLSLVRGLVELHGGSVTAASAGPGHGSEFTVRLPLLARSANATVRRQRMTTASSRRRVLVVDDNVDAAESLGELVTLLGHEAQVAYDGADALHRIEADRPDVVLCDLGLPGLSGYDVARAVRAAGIPVRLIAVSGYAQPGDLRRSTEAGFDAHIAKPAEPDRIRDLLA